MSMKKKAFLILFLGLGGLGWVSGVAMAVHSTDLARDNRVISSALTSSIIERASLSQKIEQLTAQQESDAWRLALLQERLAAGEQTLAQK